MLKKAFDKFFQNKIAILVILLGSLAWSLTMVRSGLNYSFGLGFWGANGHDGVWHIALSESLARGSFDNPVFSDSVLQNYHLGFDLLLALINQVTKIPINYLYFQILPPIFAVLIGLLVYFFVLNWRGSKREAVWAVLFVYFSSSFGFLVTFLRDRVITGESMFWSQQSVSTLINPPFALSLIFVLSGFIALQKRRLLLSILFFGLLIQIKAYAGILVLVGLFVASVYELFTVHCSRYTKIFIGSLFLNLLIYFLTKSSASGVFIWQPFWFLETMMSYSDRLGWERFYSAMTTYKMGHVWFKLIPSYLIAFLIFLVGNMGLRIIGFLFYFKNKIDSTLVFITSIAFAGIVIPTFFVQNGTPWNTIQFFYYSLFVSSILAGIVASRFGNLAKLFIVIFSILGIWTTLQHYLPKNPQAYVSNEEVEALNFLKSQPEGIVLTYLFDEYKSKEATKNPPRPLYFYDSTAYVSAFSSKQVFLEDEVNLNIMGYDWKQRRKEVLWFISNLDKDSGQDFLKRNNIKYLYLVKANSPLSGELLKLGPSDLGLEKIFENKKVTIFSTGK